MSITRLLRIFGIDLKKLFLTWFLLPKYYSHFFKFKAQSRRSKEKIRFGKNKPELYDWFDSGGTARGQYFHQDLYVAQEIYRNRPVKHVDVGSRVDGFAAHVATFRQIEVIDIRNTESSARNIKFLQSDITDIDNALYNYTDSLSCLHAIEHVGLGRYGDSIDFLGHRKAFDNLYLMLKKGGRLYLSTPIGPQRIEFNSQRVFSIAYLLDLIGDRFGIESTSYIDDSGEIHINVELSLNKIDANLDCKYGCGIFTLVKN